MKKKKHLVIGASGLVGRYLLAHLRERGFDAIGTYHHRKQPGLRWFNATTSDVDALENLLDGIDVIYYCAGLTTVDQPSRQHLHGVQNILTHRHPNSLLCYLSSDYVFWNDGPHSSDDVPRPFNPYGEHHLQAEHLIATTHGRWDIIRTANVYGLGRSNLVEELIRVRPHTFGIFPWLSTPTFAGSLATAIVEEVTRRTVAADLDDDLPNRVTHIAGPTFMSRWELAKMVCRVFQLDTELEPHMPGDEYSPRPLYAGLISDIRTVSVDEGLHAIREEMDA